MRRSFQAAIILSLLILFVALVSSFGWGENADRLVSNKAVDTLPDEMLPFFQANRQYLVQHVKRPDPPLAASANSLSTQSDAASAAPAATDFIQLDHYGPYPFAILPRDYNAAISKYNRRTLAQYGLLPWEIGVYSKKLTDSFRDRNWADVRTNAAILAHFVIAAHDPFNTTTNFDGKISLQPGVNERFGTGLVDRYQLFFFVKSSDAVYIHDPTDYSFEMVLTSHSWLEPILLADRRAHAGLTDYKEDYYDRFYAQAGAILVTQISSAATDVGSYWMTSWINAGRPQLPSQ
ncbi:MAG: hypothetical protein ABSC71_15740 [Candidatus Acidiferrales bacterium]|jgi:hypothetical protein